MLTSLARLRFSFPALLCLLVAVLFMSSSLGGCAQSRQAKLKQRGESVRASLLSERDRVAKLPTADSERAARLGHLQGLHNTLSAANVGLGIVPMFTAEAQRAIAYDVIEEVYATIEWNTPLGPADPKRAMPAVFAGNQFQFNQFGAPNPVGTNPTGTTQDPMMTPPLIR